MIRKLLPLLAVLLLAACATPGVFPHGPAIQAPAFNGKAFVMADGARLPARVWPALANDQEAEPKAVLIGVHGMNDYSNAFAMPAGWLQSRGVATYAYDQRGFGEAPGRGKWAGTETMTEDLGSVIALVRERHPDVPIALIGLSMGSAVILAGEGDGALPQTQGAILMAPAVWGWGEMNVFYRIMLWFSAHIMPNKALTGERLEVWPSDNIEMLRAFSKDPLVIKKTTIGSIYGLVSLMDRGYRGSAEMAVPALVLYGKKDQLVPARSVRKMAARIPAEKRFVIYANGYHMLERDLQAETVWRDILAWLGDHAAPLPSLDDASAPKAEEVAFPPAR
jgi:alpha-beta hydrolase superfamily lysophospholipase